MYMHPVTGSIYYEGKFEVFTVVNKSRDSSVGIALGCGLDDRGSIPGGCWEFFSKPPRPELLWGSFPGGKAAGA
jgi:hypothetical protein